MFGSSFRIFQLLLRDAQFQWVGCRNSHGHNAQRNYVQKRFLTVNGQDTQKKKLKICEKYFAISQTRKNLLKTIRQFSSFENTV